MSGLHAARRLVVKVGSALLVDENGSQIRSGWLDSLASDIADLQKRGIDGIVVSSGAVALGRIAMGLQGRKLRLEEKQAAAAIGQIALSEAWRDALGAHGCTAAQVLLTLEDTENRRRHLNARQTLHTLLKHRAVPVINENDTIATAEIRVGDNDRLAARTAQMTGADVLVLLSDIDGLYTADPRISAEAEHISVIERLTPALRAMAGAARPGISTGGMLTKLEAADIATRSGCGMIISNGIAAHPLQRLYNGERHSWFAPATTPSSARKQWLASHLDTCGRVVIDEGAAAALRQGKSLLPVGIRSVEGAFERGDCIDIGTIGMPCLARGLSGYDSRELALIAGRHSNELVQALGYEGRQAAVHRDDMVLLQP